MSFRFRRTHVNLQFDYLQFTIYVQSYLIYDLTIYNLRFMYYLVI